MFDEHAAKRSPSSSAATMTWDAFISYKSEDRGWAVALHQRLAAKDQSVFFDYQSLRAGAEWQPQLEQALAASGALIVLWSKRAASQDTMSWTEEERYLFAMREVRLPQTRRRPVIMVLLDAVPAAQAAVHHVAEILDGKYYETGDPAAPPAAVWDSLVEKVVTSIAEGHRVLAQQRRRRIAGYGLIVCMLAGLGTVAARPERTFTTCVREALIQEKKLDRDAASSAAVRLQALVSLAASGKTPAITRSNRRQPEYEVLANTNTYRSIVRCASDSNVVLPIPHLQSVAQVSSNWERPLAGAQVLPDGANVSSGCVTTSAGTCALSIPYPNEEKKIGLSASREGYSSVSRGMSVNEFLEGPSLTLVRVSQTVSIAVERNLRKVPNASVTLLLTPAGDAAWSAQCELAHQAGQGCQTTTTNANGVAVFHYSQASTKASVEVAIGRERKAFPLEISPTFRSEYTVEWDHPCRVDGDQPPRRWTGTACRNPRIVDGTEAYKIRFPKELGRCTSVSVYKCP